MRPGRQPERGGGSDALWRKLDLKPDAAFDDWLEAELSRRFDHVCCDTLDRFRREHKAVTRAGQVKGGEERHEKDDRHRLDDRTRYVLGWSNEDKIAALVAKLDDVQARGARLTERRSKLDAERRAHEERLRKIAALAVFADFRDLEWRPLVVEVEAMRRQLEELLRSSDKLRTLAEALRGVEAELRQAREAVDRLNAERGTTEEKRSQAHKARRACDEVLAAAPDAWALFPRVEALRAESGQGKLTVESCDNRQTELRVWLQARIDAEDKNLSRLQQKIVAAMQAYRGAYPLETREADASVDAAAEYRRMLDALRADDLPRFEARFKALLNENAIVEVAGFQSKLRIWEADIRERIATINGSLRAIDYNPGRYIELVADPNLDVEIREFRQDLRACTEGALTGSDDDGYSEAKFLQVKRIIERFRGRENSAEADRRWTRKVTDVRRWFSFSASEKWREDDREHEHYSDSGGKSGGQKEKLAYTVLAASLACQFGLEWSDRRSRSFRFVAIDEAFGRGSDESARYALELFSRLRLQLLIVTPLQKIHVIEPYVAAVGFAHNHEGRLSMLRNLTIEEYRAERDARA